MLAIHIVLSIIHNQNYLLCKQLNNKWNIKFETKNFKFCWQTLDLENKNKGILLKLTESLKICPICSKLARESIGYIKSIDLLTWVWKVGLLFVC